MSANRTAQKVLILGGGGMVGVEVAREAARELRPREIVISALTSAEVDEAIQQLRAENETRGWGIEFTAAPGDIFLPQALQGSSRAELVEKKELFDQLFDDIFSSSADAFRTSALHELISVHQPDVVVDCINTATAISYQDVFTTSRKVKVMLDRLEEDRKLEGDSLDAFVLAIRSLLIAQGVPQIVRHILYLHQSLSESSVRIYVKVGTTGTGGMGINIPYTHSEDKPSATLLSKSAIGFAHTGLLFLLARTPGLLVDGQEKLGTLIKEVKPGAMIGFRRLGDSHVKLPGEDGRRRPAYLLEPLEEPLKDQLQPRRGHTEFGGLGGREVPVRIVGADTGENGFFSIGEFLAITYPRQMEYVTPEEVARTAVLEIIGAATGRDVLSAIDGAITEPSYRAGILRDQAARELDRLESILENESDDFIPSIALGQLGPPRLSKLLIEAFLLKAGCGTSAFDELASISPDAMQEKVEAYLSSHPRVASLIVTIGIPILRGEGGEHRIARGPRLNIPVPRPDGAPHQLHDDAVERFARQGWVDLRKQNFAVWQERVRRIAGARADLVEQGSAGFARTNYMPEEFVPGEVVGYLLANETDESGMAGFRLF